MESWRRLTPHARRSETVLLPVIILFFLTATVLLSPARAEGYRVVTSLPAASGTGPAAGLTLSADGTTFYGTRWATSALDSLVFSVGVDGLNYQTLSSFPDRALGGLALGNSQLYGITYGVGGNQGWLYSLDSAGSNFHVLDNFRSVWPILIPGYTTPTLIGTTIYGTTGTGIFSANTDGSNVQVLQSYRPANPNLNTTDWSTSGLLQIGTKLYGTTEPFNTSDFPTIGGTLYSYDTATSTYSTLYNFTGSQSSPQGDLIAVGSTIYGMSSNGVYSIGIEGSNYQVLHTFNGTDGLVQYFGGFIGIFPELPGGLTAVGNVLYGTTGYNAYDNNLQDWGPGEVFRINMDGTGFQIVHSFSESGADGYRPFGDLTLVGNTLYGTTELGGANGGGTIYAITVPEPSSLVLAGLGLAAVVWQAHRRRRR